MSDLCKKANWALATVLGWKNLFYAGGALLGTPPDGALDSRGHAMAPDWCGNWQPFGELMVTYDRWPAPVAGQADVITVPPRHGVCEPAGFVQVADYPSRAHAVRAAVVWAVVAQLEQAMPLLEPT